MTIPGGIENERLLELFFSQSLDGFFFMMLDEPVEWGDHVDKAEVLDYAFEHQRMTKVNAAILAQFKARSPEDLLGATPAQLLAHDLVRAKETWRKIAITPATPPATFREVNECKRLWLLKNPLF